ncbi:hypothetical protein NMY22_g3705 [Coprinellus aureogranulatus]|nr:hypothetical protein NMY22_g3705 [Coprinellus aureogranulatus]
MSSYRKIEEEYLVSSDDEEDELLEDEDDPLVFKIRNLIPGASAEHKTMEDLNQMVADGDIDLDPEYQRAVVWTKPKQVALIDSIWSNHFINPLLFNRIYVEVEGAGRVPILVCMDGKQRLTSIHNFMTGQIPHKDPVTKKLWWYTAPELSRSSRLVIPEWAKQTFRERIITCVIYKNLKSQNEREIFQRVQEGVPLTSAERLQAVASPMAEWLSGLENQYIHNEGGLASLIRLEVKRGRDFQNLAHMVFCCEGLPFEERFATSHKVTPWMNREEAPSSSLKKAVEHTLRDFVTIATDKRYNQGFRTIEKKVAPVEFIFIGVLLFQLREEPNSAKGLAIHNLRRAVREQYTDLRNNQRTVKVIWQYVRQLVEDPHSPVELVEDAPAASKAASKEKGKGTKRKKDHQNDDDEDGPARRPKASSSKSRHTKPKKVP